MGLVASNGTWPFLTHPNFEEEAGIVRKHLAALWVALLPFVNEGERDKWEEYSVANQGWVERSAATLGWEAGVLPPASDCIFRLDFGSDGDAPYCDYVPLTLQVPFYAPLWSCSPPGPINYNGVDDPFMMEPLLEMLKTKVTVLSQAFGDFEYVDATKESLGDYDFQNLPTSYMLQPVFSDFGDEGEMVGFLAAFLPWYVKQEIDSFPCYQMLHK